MVHFASLTKRYPTQGSLTRFFGCDGSGSIFFIEVHKEVAETRSKRLGLRAWLGVVALQGLLVGSALVAINTGSSDEERVEHVVPEQALHQHEEFAEQFAWASGAAMVVSALVLLGRRRFLAGALTAVAVIATVVVSGLALRVGPCGWTAALSGPCSPRSASIRIADRERRGSVQPYDRQERGGGMPHRERHRSDRLGWLRAAVLGANDGIVSTASLVVGVAAAEAARQDVLVAGVAGLVAGALSMAAGEYVSVSSQADTERADLNRERHELAAQPQAEEDELTGIYVRRGLQPELARTVAQQLTASGALAAHARDELGLTEELAARPLQAALASVARRYRGTRRWRTDVGRRGESLGVGCAGHARDSSGREPVRHCDRLMKPSNRLSPNS